MEIKDIQDRIDDIDRQLSKTNISEVETRFNQDLDLLIQHTTNDFEEIKGKQDFVAPETGTVAYNHIFAQKEGVSIG
jgi:hypothetical protein